MKRRSRLLELLLRAFPADFRRAHADELRDYVAAERQHPRFATPVIGPIGFWWWASRDVLRSGFRMRFSVVDRRRGSRRRVAARTVAGAPTAAPTAAGPDHHAPHKRGEPMGSLIQDIRHAARALARTPVAAVVIVATLTVGIGMNTAIFSVVNGVLLRPLDYTEAGELVFVDGIRANEDRLAVGVSAADFRDIQTGVESLQEVAAVAVVRQNLTGIESPQQADVGWVSGNTLGMLGVEPVIGRVFTAADPPGTVVLSHDKWQRWFGGDPSVVGRAINLDAHPHTIVGVLPDDFRLDVPDLPRRLDLWKNPDDFSVNGDFWGSRTIPFFRLIGRRAAAVDLDVVRDELDGLAASLQEQFPDHAEHGVEFRATPLHEEIVGDIRPTILMLFGAVGLVLLIVCANVANLLLARAQSRRREIAVRVALGSSRWRITQLLLVESALLAIVGGGGGVLLGVLGTRAIDRLRPPELDLIEGAHVDPAVLGFAAGLSVVCVFLFGLLPALGAAGAAGRIGGASRVTAAASSRRFSRLLVAAQISLSLILLVGAGLLAASLANLQAADAGFVADNLLTFSVSLPSARYDFPQGTHQFFATLEQRLESLPGVTAAGLVWPAPLADRGWSGPGAVRGIDDDGAQMDYELVTADFFAAAGTRLVDGRTFQPADPPEVVIINRRLAERAWPRENPLGRVVAAAPWGNMIEFEVIGVSEDVRHSSLRQPAQETLYFHSRHWSWADWEVDYVVRTAADPLALVEPVREELSKLDAEVPLARPRAMSEVVDQELAGSRFALSLLGVFAGVAALLATVGLYAVMSFAVGSRRREIGIRMALGSGRGDVLRLVLRQGLGLTLAGLLVGWAGATLLARLFAATLYEVEPVDPVVYGAATLSLGLAAMIAAYVPARRATALDPVDVLRSD